jgi:large subunit ribosomal protein L37Ae
MSQGTEDVGSSGRFGPRYGTSVRRRIQAIEEVQHDEHRCPQCLTGDLERVSTSIWQCRKCDHKFAGGAYQPQTSAFGKAQASADELEEVEEAFEADEEEEEAEEIEPEPETGTVEEPEPEPEEAEPEPAAEDEDDEPDSIESLFE